MVEKSELWVYKSKKDSVSASPGKDKKKKDKKKEVTDDGIIKKDTAKQDSDKNGREDSDSDEVEMA